MALTSYMIDQASDHLGEKQVALWVFYFRKLPIYKQYSYLYSEELEEKISETEGTIKARMLNALLKEIDDLGVGEVHVGGDQRTIGAGGGDREGTHWSQTIERMTLIEEGFSVLYDDISTMLAPPSPVLNPDGSITSNLAATGQRVVYMICPSCTMRYLEGTNCRCRVY